MNSIPPVDDAGAGRTAGTEPEKPLDASGLDANALGASLTATSLQKSIAWYRDVLGFTVARTFEREGKMFAASLRAGSVAMLLTQDDGEKGSDRAKGEGISLRLTTNQDIDELARLIKERGGVLESEPFEIRGMRAFRLRDPDGFKLVISSEQ